MLNIFYIWGNVIILNTKWSWIDENYNINTKYCIFFEIVICKSMVESRTSKTGKSNFVSQDGIDSICNKMETIYGSETEKLGHIIYVVKGCLVSWASQGKNGAKPS